MWGQRTDFAPEPFDSLSMPLRRIGVLVNQLVAGSALDELEPDSSLLAFALSDYERLEKEEVERRRKSVDGTRTWDEVAVDDNARRAVAPTRIPGGHRLRVDDNRSIQTISLYKLYAGRRTERCGLAMTQYEGWVLIESDRPTFVRSSVIFSGCDDKTFFSYVPYGIVKLGDRFFAIGEDLGYEWTCYQVFELDFSGRRVVPLLPRRC
jgi:hypothetical protein